MSETYKEFRTKHKKVLNNKWNIRYPNGQFVLQRRYGKHGFGGDKIYSYGIHFNSKRRTSRTSYKGLSVIYKHGIIKMFNFQNNSFGRCNYYNNKEKCLKSAKILEFPEKLIDIFNMTHTEMTK